MHICLDCRMLVRPHTGMGRYVSSLLRAVCRTHTAHRFTCIVNPGTPPDAVPDDPRFQVAVTDSPAFSPRDQWRLPRLLEKVRPDLLHSLWFASPLAPGVPFVATLYDLTHLKYPQFYPWKYRPYYKLVALPAARRAARVMTISNASKEDLVRIAGVREERIRVVPGGVGEGFLGASTGAALTPGQAGVTIPDDYILYVGNLLPHKNVMRLVRAWGRLRAAGVTSAALVICAQPQQTWPALTGEARRLGVADALVNVAGASDETLRALYSQCRLFVFPSLSEGFGLPPLEALACGAPLVVSDIPPHREFFSGAALFADPTDEADIAAKMAEALEGGPEAEARQRAGEALAARLTWEASAEKLLAIYDELAGIRE